MQERRVTLPELVLIAATRGMIGFGAGLLLSERLGRHRRRPVGWAMFATGLVSTIPLALRFFRRRGAEAKQEEAAPIEEPVQTEEWQVFMAE